MTRIDRRYKKLATYLAEFGGINSNLLLFLTIFVKFINEFWAEQKLMNKILKFKEHLKVTNPNHINLIKEKFKKREFNTQDSFNNVQTNFMKSNFQNLKEDLDTFQEQNQDKSSQFSLEMTEKNEKITPLEINIESEQRIQACEELYSVINHLKVSLPQEIPYKIWKRYRHTHVNL